MIHGLKVVAQEIRLLQHRINVLTMYRDRIVAAETYLLGRRALKRANLMPREPPPVSDIGAEEIRWVTRSSS